MTLAAGTVLGRYVIQSRLGAGGMGEVYLAQDTQLQRTIALKILPDRFASDQQHMRRFIQEAKASAALRHPNIAHIYEIGATDGVHFISMEFVEGETLRQLITRGPLKIDDALELAAQIASSLVAAHEAGIIHRDIKPENVIVRRDGYLKVLDFGLAKLIEHAEAMDTEAPTRALINTAAGLILGTANYMSPEQARGQDVDARTDVWSLGVVLYEMVTGICLFKAQPPVMSSPRFWSVSRRHLHASRLMYRRPSNGSSRRLSRETEMSAIKPQKKCWPILGSCGVDWNLMRKKHAQRRS